MTKSELLKKIASFDDDAILIFSNDVRDFRDLESDGASIHDVLQVNTGTYKYIVFVE